MKGSFFTAWLPFHEGSFLFVITHTRVHTNLWSDWFRSLTQRFSQVKVWQVNALKNGHTWSLTEYAGKISMQNNRKIKTKTNANPCRQQGFSPTLRCRMWHFAAPTFSPTCKMNQLFVFPNCFSTFSLEVSEVGVLSTVQCSSTDVLQYQYLSCN